MHQIAALFLALLLAFGQLPSLAAVQTSAFSQVTDRPGLYAFSPQSGEGWPYTVKAHGDLLLILQRQSWEGGALQLTLFDMQTMEKRAGITLSGSPNANAAYDDGSPDSGYFEAGFLADGRPYTIDSYSKQLVIYDAALKAQTSFTPPKGDDYFYPYVEPSGERLWLADTEGQWIKGFDVSGGKEQTLRCAFKDSWWFSSLVGMQDGKLLVVFADTMGHGALHVYDPDTGNLTLRPVLNYFSYYLGAALAYRVQGARALFYPLWGEGGMLQIGTWRAGENPYIISKNLLLSNHGQTGELRLYDLKNNLLLASITPPASQNELRFDSAILSDAGFAVLTCTDFDALQTSFYVWRYAQIQLDLPAGITLTSMEDIRQENDLLAEEIQRSYGVRVYLRREGHGFGNTTYYGTLCDDELTIAEGLKKLRSFLTALPPTLLTASLLKDYTGLGFYLSGPILPKGNEGIDSAAGLSSDDGQERYIIFNAFDDGVATTLAHEFMHLLEDRLEEADLASGRNLLGGFEQLSPQGYENGGYNYAYRGADGYQLNDPMYTWNADFANLHLHNVWYIDSYSRSFPLEDRARIFENLFTAGDSLPMYFESPHLMAKAKYLCALIRAAFPELASGPAPIWEEYIPAPAGGDWSEYLILPLADAA